MTIEDGKWVMDISDSKSEEMAFKRAAEELLPVVRMYKTIGRPGTDRAHIVPWILFLLADDLLKAEHLPRSKNIDFLTCGMFKRRETKPLR
jgi:hypothetical protein